MRPEHMPDWVPETVKRMAAVMPVGAAISERLLTDSRMKPVWPHLQRRKVAAATIDALSPLLRMETWEICRFPASDTLDEGLSSQDRACAAFYAAIVLELANCRAIATRAQADEFAKPWISAAELCWSVMRHEPRPAIDPELAKALSIVGEYLEDQGRLREQRNSPYIVERSSKERGDDKIRARVRALATAAHAIFGQFSYGTVATVATVALQINPAITPQSVRNWCRGLPCQ
jgi:hypothetical protein